MPYSPTWNSIRNHPSPKWLREAKFGIYTHWGIYSVPAFGPNATWYPYNMYRRGTEQHRHHVETYGDPSVFGYKDFIPMFDGRRFDAEAWADLFRRAGARFAGPVGEHHDGFCMWDTALSEWSAAKMGPRTDVVGKLERAIRNEGMKFMIALHHAENWFFYPHWESGYDTSDPRYEGLYGPPHDLPASGEAAGDARASLGFDDQAKPTKAFLDMWLAKTVEAIDRYRPDLLWFDFGIRYVNERYRLAALAYYYNRAEEWGREVGVTYKWHDLVPGSGTVDLELGRLGDLAYHEWLTDTTVDDGSGWGYLKKTEYKKATTLVHYLADNVSKNGYLLLNVGPKPDGTIPEEAEELLVEMGRWLEVNGEAIYGTSPWAVYGEGPTKVEAGYFNEAKGQAFTAEDIRYTVKDDFLYAICLGSPGERVVLKSLAGRLYEDEVRAVTMLGNKDNLPFKWTQEGLTVKLPAVKPSRHACVLRVERRDPFSVE